MQNDNAITRLLYAILSQKCLKDINWDQVAHNPILNSEITNGHAARMRYSRFKKQMDAASGVVPPPTPRKPRKNRVEKTRSPKKETKAGVGAGVKVESERERDRERKERENGVKSDYPAKEGTGESLFSAASASASMSGIETPELDDSGMIAPTAVSLAQHDLSSGAALSHSSRGYFYPGQEAMHFQDHIPIKSERERKLSANTLRSGLFAPAYSLPLQLDITGQGQTHNVTSSVANSTMPSTPRMCIEEQDRDLNLEQERSPNLSSQSLYLQHHHRHPDAEEGFPRASVNGEDMDDLMHGFGMPHPGHDHTHEHGHGLYSPLLNDGDYSFGMGIVSPGELGMGLGLGMGVDQYDGFWNHGGGGGGGESSKMGGEAAAAGVDGATVVKKEERWEEAYRHG